MAIKISYTPYGAVGGLAEHAGRAQQAVREQQYAEQEARQTEQIEAGREEWQTKLAAQQEQFAMSQAAQQEEMFRRQQASEFATMKQAQIQRAQIAAQEEQFEQTVALKEQAFELQRAQEARLLQSAQANIRAQEMRGAFDFKKLESSKIDMTENLAEWEKIREFISPEEYAAGRMAISLGKVPRIKAKTSALIEENRRLGIEKKKLAMAAGLTDRGRTVARDVFEDIFGRADLGVGGFFWGASEGELIDNYKSYQVKTGYSSKNDASKRELDNVFDRSIIDYEQKGWFDYYSAWDPESKAVKDLRVQSKGVINDEDATKFMNKAIAANPGKSIEECKPIAIDMALKAGYEL